MTTYVAISSGEIDADSPITADLMSKLRDNPLAIAEGDASAPRVKAAALNTSTNTVAGSLGSGTLKITIGAYAFWPSLNYNANTSVTFDPTGTTADNGALLLTQVGGSAAVYSIKWRSIS